MKKKLILWSVIAVIAMAAIVFWKVAPVWVSLTGIIAFACGAVIGWCGKMAYDRYKENKQC